MPGLLKAALSAGKKALRKAGNAAEQAEKSTAYLGLASPAAAAAVPSQIKPLSLAAQGKLGAAAGSLVGGAAGEAAVNVSSRALKTAIRAKRMGKTPKQVAIAGVRGATTSAIKNRRLIADAATGGSVTVAEGVNSLVKKSPFGKTRLGKALTKDISTPLLKKARIRKKLREKTGGLFSRNF